jgi:hypothetical protein
MMTTTPTAVEINCETGETTERPLTAKELADMETRRNASLARQAEAEAEAERIAGLKQSAKAKLIAGEPLTDEEASILVI